MNTKSFIKYPIIIFLLCFCHTTYGQELTWTHYGLRPLAMGNAFVAVADDFNALFYNPAGLARIEEWDGELLNPKLTVSKNSMALYGEVQGLSGGDGGDNTSELLDLFKEQSGKTQFFGFGLTPHLIFPHFGFGIGLDIIASMVFHAYPSVFVDLGPRIIIPVGFAFNMLEKRLSLGFTVKSVIQGGINREFSIQDIEAFQSKDDDASDTGPKLEDFVEGGIGYGADVGLLFTPTKFMEPTIGLSVADVGETKFEKYNVGAEALAAPQPRRPAVNIGFGIKPYQGHKSYLLTAIDMQAVNQPFSFSKKLNLGLEWGIGSIVKIQTGLHQGYLGGGFQIDVGLANFRLVTYGTEVGPVAGSMEDRRYAVQFKLLI